MIKTLKVRRDFYRCLATQIFVPKHQSVGDEEVEKIKSFLCDKPNVLVLTGAGISTESGIPDYRSEGVGLYHRTNHKPVQYPDFIKSQATRKRYWARNFIGWPKFSRTEPNVTHLKLAKMEREGRLSHVITQNVDFLHGKAGTKNLIELHGNGFEVMCIGDGAKKDDDQKCDYSIARHEFQNILTQLNPSLHEKANNLETSSAKIRPDGDVEISQEDIEKFYLPECPKCSGMLKPNIVFFGDNVPRTRIEKVVRCILDSDGLLVLGSSLTVFSGYRIVLQTKELGKEVALINIGPTRADHIVDVKINAKCSDVLKKL